MHACMKRGKRKQGDGKEKNIREKVEKKKKQWRGKEDEEKEGEIGFFFYVKKKITTSHKISHISYNVPKLFILLKYLIYVKNFIAR